MRKSRAKLPSFDETPKPVSRQRHPAAGPGSGGGLFRVCPAPPGVFLPANRKTLCKAPEKAPEKATEKATEKHEHCRLRLPPTASTLPMDRASSDISPPQQAVSVVTTPMERGRSRENNSINTTTDPSVNGPLQSRSIPRGHQRTQRHQWRYLRRDLLTLRHGLRPQPTPTRRLSRAPSHRVRIPARHIPRATRLPIRQQISRHRSTALTFPTPPWPKQPRTSPSSTDGTARCRSRALCLSASGSPSPIFPQRPSSLADFTSCFPSRRRERPRGGCS